jgi:hypothetical protein
VVTFFCRQLVPGTKGKPLEEITTFFERRTATGR